MEVHSGNGDIVRKTYEYPYSHMDILYGSMQVMSRLLHVYKDRCFTEE